MDRDEMIEILEGIARDGGDTARIAAIKTLIQLESGDLDGDDLESEIQRIKAK